MLNLEDHAVTIAPETDRAETVLISNNLTLNRSRIVCMEYTNRLGYATAYLNEDDSILKITRSAKWTNPMPETRRAFEAAGFTN